MTVELKMVSKIQNPLDVAVAIPTMGVHVSFKFSTKKKKGLLQ